MGGESCILLCRHELEPSALLNERFDGGWRREGGTVDWRSNSAESIGFELVVTSCRGNGDVAESSTALGSSAFTNHTVDIHRPFWSSSLLSSGFLSSRIVAWYVRRFTSLTRLVPVAARDTPFLEYVSGEIAVEATTHLQAAAGSTTFLVSEFITAMTNDCTYVVVLLVRWAEARAGVSLWSDCIRVRRGEY